MLDYANLFSRKEDKKKDDEIILKYSITWNYFFLCIDSKSMAMQKFITLSVISI